MLDRTACGRFFSNLELDTTYYFGILREMKLKRGDPRADGKVFFCYSKTAKLGEYWVTPEKLSYLNRYNYLWQLRKKKKWARGNIGPDGRVFERYVKGCKNGEYWVSSAQFGKNSSKLIKNKIKKVLTSAFKSREGRSKRTADSSYTRALKNCAIPHGYRHKDSSVVFNMASRVSICTGIKFEVDHIKPLHLGGKHHYTNFQILPAVWNRRKSCSNSFKLPEPFKNYHAQDCISRF
jgi:hypothetical protein